MIKYLLDTNHASRLMSSDERILDQLRVAGDAGDEFAISMTVVGELYFAVHASRHYLRNLQRLTQLINALQIFPFDRAAAEEFGRIQAEQKAKGRPIPSLDAQIAAVARHYSLILLTADKHFDAVDGVTVENWLTN